MKSFASVLLTVMVLVTLLLASCAPAPAPTPVSLAPTPTPVPKVAMIMANPADDMGWGTQGYLGIMKAMEEHGVDVSVSECVEVADAEAVMHDYASRGYDLIIAHGFQYSEAISEVSKDFPDKWFVITCGNMSSPNLASYNVKVHELGYLAGVLAALMSKSGKIAGLAGMELPGCVALLEGYRLGAKSVNPDIDVRLEYLGTFADIAKGKEATLALIAEGFDVFFHDAGLDGAGMIKAAEEKGVHAIGFPLDQSMIAPETVIASALQRYDKVMVRIVGDFLSGEMKGEVYRPGMAEGAYEMVYTDLVPEGIRKEVERVAQDIASGKITVPEITKPTE